MQHLVKSYNLCIIKGFKIHRLGTYSHMVTVTGTPFAMPYTTAPCHLQVIATKQHKQYCNDRPGD